VGRLGRQAEFSQPACLIDDQIDDQM